MSYYIYGTERSIEEHTNSKQVIVNYQPFNAVKIKYIRLFMHAIRTRNAWHKHKPCRHSESSTRYK